MAESNISEATPLMPAATSQRRAARAQRVGSAHRRTVDALKRAQVRLAPRRPTANAEKKGIDKVCEELEESERSGNRFFWVSIFFICNHVVGGAITLHFLEGWSVYDAIYFCIVTTTTVGYGDITPEKTMSKLYVVYYVIVSIGLISTMLAYLIGLLLDQQEELLLAAIVDDNDEEQVDPQPADDHDMDMMEARPEAQLYQRIISATKRLDMSDYYGLGFSSFFLITVLFIGFMVFVKLENLSVIDALYATIISATTVGFGDYDPTKNSTKVIISVWLCFSTIAVGKVVADFTDASVKVKQRAVSRRLLTASMDMDSLKMLDRDNDGSVDKCEFVTELLVRSGKVERKDVDTILLRFHQLDKNKSGGITTDEVS